MTRPVSMSNRPSARSMAEDLCSNFLPDLTLDVLTAIGLDRLDRGTSAEEEEEDVRFREQVLLNDPVSIASRIRRCSELDALRSDGYDRMALLEKQLTSRRGELRAPKFVVELIDGMLAVCKVVTCSRTALRNMDRIQRQAYDDFLRHGYPKHKTYAIVCLGHMFDGIVWCEGKWDQVRRSRDEALLCGSIGEEEDEEEGGAGAADGVRETGRYGLRWSSGMPIEESQLLKGRWSEEECEANHKHHLKLGVVDMMYAAFLDEEAASETSPSFRGPLPLRTQRDVIDLLSMWFSYVLSIDRWKQLLLLTKLYIAQEGLPFLSLCQALIHEVASRRQNEIDNLVCKRTWENHLLKEYPALPPLVMASRSRAPSSDQRKRQERERRELEALLREYKRKASRHATFHTEQQYKEARYYLLACDCHVPPLFEEQAQHFVYTNTHFLWMDLKELDHCVVQKVLDEKRRREAGGEVTYADPFHDTEVDQEDPFVVEEDDLFRYNMSRRCVRGYKKPSVNGRIGRETLLRILKEKTLAGKGDGKEKRVSEYDVEEEVMEVEVVEVVEEVEEVEETETNKENVALNRSDMSEERLMPSPKRVCLGERVEEAAVVVVAEHKNDEEEEEQGKEQEDQEQEDQEQEISCEATLEEGVDEEEEEEEEEEEQDDAAAGDMYPIWSHRSLEVESNEETAAMCGGVKDDDDLLQLLLQDVPVHPLDLGSILKQNMERLIERCVSEGRSVDWVRRAGRQANFRIKAHQERTEMWDIVFAPPSPPSPSDPVARFTSMRVVCALSPRVAQSIPLLLEEREEAAVASSASYDSARNCMVWERMKVVSEVEGSNAQTQKGHASRLRRDLKAVLNHSWPCFPEIRSVHCYSPSSEDISAYLCALESTTAPSASSPSSLNHTSPFGLIPLRPHFRSEACLLLAKTSSGALRVIGSSVPFEGGILYVARVAVDENVLTKGIVSDPSRALPLFSIVVGADLDGEAGKGEEGEGGDADHADAECASQLTLDLSQPLPHHQQQLCGEPVYVSSTTYLPVTRAEKDASRPAFRLSVMARRCLRKVWSGVHADQMRLLLPRVSLVPKVYWPDYFEFFRDDSVERPFYAEFPRSRCMQREDGQHQELECALLPLSRTTYLCRKQEERSLTFSQFVSSLVGSFHAGSDDDASDSDETRLCRSLLGDKEAELPVTRVEKASSAQEKRKLLRQKGFSACREMKSGSCSEFGSGFGFLCVLYVKEDLIVDDIRREFLRVEHMRPDYVVAFDSILRNSF